MAGTTAGGSAAAGDAFGASGGSNDEGEAGGGRADAAAGTASLLGGAAGAPENENPSRGGEDANAGAGGGIADPTELRPDQVVGLSLWLNAEHCETDTNLRVASCSDLSGHANDAKQLVTSLQPALVDAAVNGLPALSFDGGDAPLESYASSTLLVADATSLRFGLDDFTFLIVLRWQNDAVPDFEENEDDNTIDVKYGGYGAVLQKVEPWPPFRGLALFANYPTSIPYAAYRRFAFQLEIANALAMGHTDQLNDGAWRLFTSRRFGSDSMGVRINGEHEVVMQVSPTIDVSALAQPLIIGGGPGAPLRGQIAEIVALKGVLPETTLIRLERHLIVKYDL